MRRFPLRRTDPHTLAGATRSMPSTSRTGPSSSGTSSACPSCRQETQGLHEATAMLAATSVTAPPDALRGRVLAAASRTRQGSPVAGPVPRAARPRRRWGLAAACVALAAALAFGGLAYHDQQQLSQEQSRARAVAAVLGAPDAAMMTARAASGGSATVVMSHHERTLVFTAARLPALPSAQRYELWLMGGGRARAAGMPPPPHAGVTAPVVVSGLRSGDTVAVTVEPAAGASKPTSPMVVHLALPS